MTLTLSSQSAGCTNLGTGETSQEPVSEETPASPAASDHSDGSHVPYYILDPNGHLFHGKDEIHQPWLVEVSKPVAIQGTLKWTMSYRVLESRTKGQHIVEYICNPEPQEDKRVRYNTRYSSLISSVNDTKTTSEFPAFLRQISYSEDYQWRVVDHLVSLFIRSIENPGSFCLYSDHLDD